MSKAIVYDFVEKQIYQTVIINTKANVIAYSIPFFLFNITYLYLFLFFKQML
jgi:hypothetical protein